MDLSIIIVSYNTKELTSQTIRSIIEKEHSFQYEIIVVDNASKDDSVETIKEKFSYVKLIEMNSNLGFSKANNIAIKEAKGEFILLLNSDTVVIDDCLEKCIQYLKKETDIGALGCKVLLGSGELDHACRRGFPTPLASLFYFLKLGKIFPKSQLFNQYTLANLPDDEISVVDSIMGAFMMVRKEVINRIGLLDEDFFMYGEDIDWCYRIKEAGWLVVYYPYAEIIHFKGGSSKKKRGKIIVEFHRAMYLFYKKHYYRKYNFLVNLLVYTGICIKLTFALLFNALKLRR